MKLIFALLVCIAVGFFLHNVYQHSQYRQIKACEKIFLSNLDPENPEIKYLIEQRRFKNLNELVEDKCEFWVKNGQIFAQ